MTSGHKAVGADRLLVREWDLATVVFDRKTQDTHFLTHELHAVLGALDSTPASPAQLAVRLKDVFDFEGSDDVEGFVERSLADLASRGLVETVPLV